ncbi:glycosyltransferase family 4 protein [candidate division WWE3 bacterium]|uniref:Glycosyltransferase family 4 protein n=1 Tax=candidate division WWE3 bacterium TaxID=2053526 RepID=A0A955LVV2_UNCKA|nr:glycosyltransferase family 4 protein [candidate division WWE3 bacterium]
MLIGIDASRITINERTGTENYAYNVIHYLAKVDKDNQYRLYFQSEPSELFFNELTAKNPNFTYVVIPWPRLWTQGGLALELLINPVDVVFISAHTMPVLRRPGQKFVVTIHGLEYMYMPQYERIPDKWYLTKSTEFVSRFADHIIAVSEFTKQSLLEHGWGAQEDRITVVPEGVNTGFFYERDNQEILRVLGKYNITAPYFFFISTIQPRKNVPGMVEAFAEALPALQKLGDYSLVIAGKSGWKFDAVEKAMKEEGLEGKVQLIGRIPDEDVPALMSGARALVYPSFVEGFGLPALESMACGTPCILTDKGAVPEVGGDTAMYVDPYDIMSMSQAMITMAVNDTLHADLSKQGKMRTAQFTWEKTAKEIVEVFEKTVNEI